MPAANPCTRLPGALGAKPFRVLAAFASLPTRAYETYNSVRLDSRW